MARDWEAMRSTAGGCPAGWACGALHITVVLQDACIAIVSTFPVNHGYLKFTARF